MSGLSHPGAEGRYRRSPHLVCYWTAAGPILENYATGLRGPGAPLVHGVLEIFDRWRPIEDLVRKLPNHPRRSLTRLVEMLVSLTFLQRSDGQVHPADAALSEWSGWSPAASFFHCTTRDVQYSSDLEESGRRTRAQARRVPMPPVIKQYPRAPTIELPPPTCDGEFADVLRARRTWRQFSTRPASLHVLGDVLSLTFGVQRWVELPGIGKVALKSSPSGGARHPIECYALALRVAGLPRGLYHYRPDTHELERLSEGATMGQVKKYLPGQPWYGDASVLVIMTAVFARTRWRYPFARAYRVVLAEAGHLCQTFCLSASWRGLAPFCTMALADSRFAERFGQLLVGVTHLDLGDDDLALGRFQPAQRALVPLHAFASDRLFERRATPRDLESVEIGGGRLASFPSELVAQAVEHGLPEICLQGPDAEVRTPRSS